jgi:hypothetical protein
MRRLVLALLLAGSVVSDASAEPPTGFSEFPWGTSPDIIRDQVLAKRCRATSENRRGWYSVQCNDYSVEGISVPILRFDFEPADALAGYYMSVARGSYRRFRDLVLKRFGPPTSRRSVLWQGSTMSWTSDTVTATLIEKCGPDASCMEVTTAPLDRKRQEIMDRERRDAFRSF